jgi:hydroxypyruvate reductase
VFPSFREHLRTVIEAVLKAVDPAEAVVRSWPTDPAVAESLRKGVLVSAGKASVLMALAAVERCGVKPSVGVAIVPAGTRPPASLHDAGVRLFEADHPLPTQRNLIAARAAGDAARLAASRRLPLLALISGGASAHLTFPERGLTLSDIRNVTEALLKAGATIAELNVVRTCCEQLKGGGLARLAAPSTVYAMILSDVLGDPVKVIASGPTADGRPLPTLAMRVLETRGVADAAPNVTAKLRAMIDRPAPPPPMVENALNMIVGSNTMAVVGARDALEKLGYVVAEARMNVDGEARVLGQAFATALLKARESNPGKPVAIVWGGETTVTVGQNSRGFGGRNQEGALAAAIGLSGRQGVAGMFFATDGADGLAPPGARPHAGAIITGESAGNARAAGVDPAKILAAHDSRAFVDAAGAAMPSGPGGGTGTNVNDIWVGLGYPEAK